MKKVMLLLCLLFLSGCAQHTTPYPFPNQGEDISRIDLVYNYNPSGEGTNRDYFFTVKTLFESEAVSFATEIYQLETVSGPAAVLWGYGDYIAIIYYCNGDIEYLGTANIEFVEKGTEATGYSQYCFRNQAEDFEMIFNKYIR